MGKRVLILTASLRPHSNSDLLAASFARGAQDAGHTVETISLKGKHIAFCRGCLACQQTRCCVIDDDAAAIAEAVKNADVLAFASPVYYYCVSGQLKTLLDRCNPLFPAEYAFRKVYLLLTAADSGPDVASGAQKAVQGWVDCFERAELSGTIFAGGVDAPGEAAGSPALQEAYRAGQGV